jgi:hypothetical protein
MWIRFWDWMTEREGWKAFSGLVYLVICIFDFIIVPSWIGLMRQSVSPLDIALLSDLEPTVQVELIKAMTYQHEPFTLKGAGLFHLAFGALLTGSAIVGRKDIK